MKINGSKVISYDPITGSLKMEDTTEWYLAINLNVTFDDERGSTDSGTTIELIKQGVTPDEIIKLKNNDLI